VVGRVVAEGASAGALLVAVSDIGLAGEAFAVASCCALALLLKVSALNDAETRIHFSECMADLV
jgi:hypothetical protein